MIFQGLCDYEVLQLPIRGFAAVIKPVCTCWSLMRQGLRVSSSMLLQRGCTYWSVRFCFRHCEQALHCQKVLTDIC